jgi:hypothetical protein
LNLVPFQLFGPSFCDLPSVAQQETWASFAVPLTASQVGTALANVNWYNILLAAAALLLVAGGILSWWLRRPRDPEEIERQRRVYLNRVGRIVEGHILEITEALHPPEPSTPASAGVFARRVVPPAGGGNGKRSLVFYSYSIRGVTYETAQDVTGLEERACLEKIVAGQPASVKYDPANPSNSILIADDWSGLH